MFIKFINYIFVIQSINNYKKEILIALIIEKKNYRNSMIITLND